MSGLVLCDRRMIVFNFLPSKTLHPSRYADYGVSRDVAGLDAVPAVSAAWHRRWSRSILQHEGLLDAPVTELDTAGLPVAVLPYERLAMLARRLGVVLCGPRLRRAISGDAVRALQAGLGEDALGWIKRGRVLHAGLAGPMFQDAAEALRTVSVAGHAALYAAFHDATPRMGRRVLLKLPRLSRQRSPGMSPHPPAGTSQPAGVAPPSCEAAPQRAATSRAAPPPPESDASESWRDSGWDSGWDSGSSAIHEEVTAALDGETAMALALALSDEPAMGGRDGISAR